MSDIPSIMYLPIFIYTKLVIYTIQILIYPKSHIYHILLTCDIILFVVTFVHPTYVWISLIWGFTVQLSL